MSPAAKRTATGSTMMKIESTVVKPIPELKLRGIGAGSVEGMEMLEYGERDAHGSDGKRGGDESSGEHQKEFPEDEIDARNGAGKDGFHGAAFFFPGGDVHGGIHAAGEAEQNDHVADDAAEGRAADFFGRGDIVLFDFEWF